MTDDPPADAPVVTAPAAATAALPYAGFSPRAQPYRLVLAVAALVLGFGGVIGGLFTTWYTFPWTMASSPAQVTVTVAAYAISFLANLTIGLFGLALLFRSPRAWHAAVAYFCVQLIQPLAAVAVFPFVGWRLWQQGTPQSYFMLSGYLTSVANGLAPLLVLALLTRPLVHDMIEQWSRGDGAAARAPG